MQIIHDAVSGLFCLSGCPAQRATSTTFNSAHEAIVNGYNPCPQCKPLEVAEQTPDEIRYLLQRINDEPTKKIKDYALVEQHIDPHKVRQWFKLHHQMTFHAYQRMFRINRSYLPNPLQTDNKVNNVNNDTVTISALRFPTPLGPMMACTTEHGICLVEFTDRKMLESELIDLKKRLKAEIVYQHHRHFDVLIQQITEYFQGTRPVFALPLHTPGTAFQQQVWQGLMTIPYGEIRSYSEQAKIIGHPSAIRAVANANGMNRIAIIIPCHRVIGADGSLTGYGGGLERKKWLLELENSNK